MPQLLQMLALFWILSWEDPDLGVPHMCSTYLVSQPQVDPRL